MKEENKKNIGQLLSEAIEAYADSKVTGNQALIQLAVSHLNGLLAGAMILTPEERENLEKEVDARNNRIAELEAKVCTQDAIEAYPEDFDSTVGPHSSIERFNTLGGK